jgi:hypothetical protein
LQLHTVPAQCAGSFEGLSLAVLERGFSPACQGEHTHIVFLPPRPKTNPSRNSSPVRQFVLFRRAPLPWCAPLFSCARLLAHSPVRQTFGCCLHLNTLLFLSCSLLFLRHAPSALSEGSVCAPLSCVYLFNESGRVRVLPHGHPEGGRK